ncbi:MAG: glycosyltransferase family 39 protein [Candidatus Omnitrophica bacterium]|nr:glycosyltransferase family 39 protein [Candidatus Omnitrophota bacterium]
MKLDASDASLRFMSCLFGLVSIFLLYRILMDWFNPQVALIGAFLLAVSPVHVRFSREVAPYVPQACLLLGSLVCWFRGLQARKRTWLWWLLCALLSAGSHYLHPIASTTFLVIGFVTLLGWWFGYRIPGSKETRSAQSFSIIPPLVAGTLALLLIYWQVQENWRNAEKYLGTASEPVPLRAYFEHVGYLMGGINGWHVVYLFVPLILAGLVWLFFTSRLFFLLLVGWCGGTLAIWAAFSKAQSSFFDHHYFNSHLPAFIALIALGVEVVGKLPIRIQVKKNSRIRIFQPTLICLFFILTLYILIPSISSEFLKKWPDYRGAGQFLSSLLNPEDRYYICPEQYLGFKVNYYCPQIVSQEAKVEIFFDSNLQSELEEKGGNLYVVSRTPLATTNTIETRKFGSVSTGKGSLLYISWLKKMNHSPQIFEIFYKLTQGKYENPKKKETNYLEEAKALIKANKLELARKLLTQAATAAPHLYRIRRQKGELLLQMGIYEEAIADLEAAYNKSPQSEKWWLLSLQAKAYTALKQFPQALTVLDAALKEPDNEKGISHLLVNKGEVELKAGLVDQAYTTFRQLVERDPRSSTALIRLGGIELKRGEKDLARQHLQSALDLNDANHTWAEKLLQGIQ